jgi:hypothetical protein
MRKIALPRAMRRRIARWLCDHMAYAEKVEWAAAMGVSVSRVTSSLSENHCEGFPIRIEDLLFLPARVRSPLFGLLDTWAESIARGDL